MNTILLIEDDKDLNVGLTYDLEAENYKVYSTLTLGEGMSVLSEKEVDLILLDGNLPDGDGFDFCRAVKSESDIPVIFLTARDRDLTAVRTTISRNRLKCPYSTEGSRQPCERLLQTAENGSNMTTDI